jgi:hypothetical protein
MRSTILEANAFSVLGIQKSNQSLSQQPINFLLCEPGLNQAKRCANNQSISSCVNPA